MKLANPQQVWFTIALFSSAGLALSAQSMTAEPPAPKGMAMTPVPSADVMYSSARRLGSLAVMNQNAERIGTVTDMILDRGSGRVEYLVVKTGGTLGFGGREVALPYSSFTTDAGELSRFTLAATPEQMKQYNEYTRENWKEMRDTRRAGVSPLSDRLAADATAPADPYAGTLSAAKTARVEGVVTAVERVPTSTFGEHVEIDVRSSDGALHRVALGPSWYVNLAPSAPMRGDQVMMNTLILPRDPESLYVATSLMSGEKELKLRESDGRPLWTPEATSHGTMAPQLRYVLMSELSGMPIDARGQTCGKVQDLIVDRRTGQTAFISIDPDQNFMGIADTKRLIPWSVGAINEKNVVRIDASKAMVLASVKTPTDPTTLGTVSEASRVYAAFDVQPSRAQWPGSTQIASDAWATNGLVIRSMDANSHVALAGKVIDVSEVALGGNTGKARVLKLVLDGTEKQECLVVIGPFPGNSASSMYKAGDALGIDAVRVSIDGKDHWVARSIMFNQNRRILVSEDNIPAW